MEEAKAKGKAAKAKAKAKGKAKATGKACARTGAKRQRKDGEAVGDAPISQ